MGRNPKINRHDICAATIDVIAEGGPRAATLSALSKRLGAPTGSIYHRYGSRELLLADTWLSIVTEFQDGFVEELGEPNLEALKGAALYMPRWIRSNMSQARVMLLHRREDFVDGEWPTEYAARAEKLHGQIGHALREVCRGLFGRVTKSDLLRLRFALLDAPYGATKPFVQRSEKPSALIDTLLVQTMMTTLADGRVAGK